jgi:O-succinylbenzoate synthase
MKIDSLEVFHVALPLLHPQQTPMGRFDKLQTVLVAMTSGSTVGWGEASPGNAPLAGPEWAAGVFACICEWIAPALAGATLDSGNDLQSCLAPLAGNRYAKAAVDTAWWDLLARLQGRPLYQVLGGQTGAMEVGVSFDRMDSIDDFLAAIRKAFEAGYARVELKFRPGWDVSMLNIVRQEFPTERLHVDIEGGMTLGNMELLCRLDDFMLAMIEQPLAADDLVGHAMVQETIRTPICLAESITTLAQAEIALELHSAKYLNIEPGRVGGLTPAMAIHDACHDGCTPCRLGSMPQSAIGTRIGLALGTKSNFSYPADFFPSDALLSEDLADPPATERNEEGTLQAVLSSAPGIGVEPDRARLDRFCIARTKV